MSTYSIKLSFIKNRADCNPVCVNPWPKNVNYVFPRLGTKFGLKNCNCKGENKTKESSLAKTLLNFLESTFYVSMVGPLSENFYFKKIIYIFKSKRSAAPTPSISLIINTKTRTKSTRNLFKVWKLLLFSVNFELLWKISCFYIFEWLIVRFNSFREII